MSATTRRGALRGASIAGLLSVPGIAAVGQSAKSNPDAELIRICHRFAEDELVRQHRYIVAPENLADEQDAPPDWGTYNWIAETPARTPEGCHAKAVAYLAAERTEAIRRSNIETMARDELEGALKANRQIQAIADALREKDSFVSLRHTPAPRDRLTGFAGP